VYGIALEAGCFIAKPGRSVNTGLGLVDVGVEVGKGCFDRGFVIISLWCDKHFNGIVLAHAG